MSLPYAILAALINRPCSGYDLVKRFNKSVEGFWSASHQQIYKALAQLEADGYLSSEKIEQVNRPNKKLYAVTDSGRSHLHKWVGESGSIAPIKSDLLVKLSAGHIASIETLLPVVQTYYEQHKQRLKSYQAIAKQYAQLPELSRPAQFQYLSLRAGIRQQLAWISWCEEVLSFLGQPVAEKEPLSVTGSATTSA